MRACAYVFVCVQGMRLEVLQRGGRGGHEGERREEQWRSADRRDRDRDRTRAHMAIGGADGLYGGGGGVGRMTSPGAENAMFRQLWQQQEVMRKQVGSVVIVS